MENNTTDAQTEKLCECGCGRVVTRRFFKGHQNFVKDTRWDKNGHWKGGTYRNSSGYVMVYRPWHHRSMANGYVREHVLIAEKTLGKPLPEQAQIHHYGDVGDNTKIVLCENQQYHYLLHTRSDAMASCGDPNKRRCKFCGEYDHVDNLHCRQFPPYGWNIYHLKCAREYDRERRSRKNGA